MQHVAKRGNPQLTLNFIFFPLPLWVPYSYFSPYIINAIAGTMVNFSQLNAFFPPPKVRCTLVVGTSLFLQYFEYLLK